MTDDERRAYLAESLFLNSREIRERPGRGTYAKIDQQEMSRANPESPSLIPILSLNYLATRFQCTWPWSTLVMLCDGRIVCGCADPYGKRVLGDAKTASISEIWNDTRSARCAPS